MPAREAAVRRKAASVLREQTGEASRLRQVLGFPSERESAAGAVDLFAMPVALSPAGEALWNEAMAQIERDRKDSRLNRPRKLAL